MYAEKKVVFVFSCYLLYLSAVRENLDLVQNGEREFLHIELRPNDSLQCFPVLSFHTWVA